MSAPTFREGDLVWWKFAAPSNRHRVRNEGNGLLDVDGVGCRAAHEFVLVACPVRAGDVLRYVEDDEGWRMRVERLGEPLRVTLYAPGTADTPDVACPLVARGPAHRIVHEDGTTIDLTEACAVPAAEPLAAPVTAVDPPPLDPDRLARALFETDPRIIAFVAEVADHRRPRASDEDVDEWPSYSDGRYRGAMQIAWERDELGARTEARERARAIVERLGGGS